MLEVVDPSRLAELPKETWKVELVHDLLHHVVHQSTVVGVLKVAPCNRKVVANVLKVVPCGRNVEQESVVTIVLHNESTQRQCGMPTGAAAMHNKDTVKQCGMPTGAAVVHNESKGKQRSRGGSSCRSMLGRGAGSMRGAGCKDRQHDVAVSLGRGSTRGVALVFAIVKVSPV